MTVLVLDPGHTTGWAVLTEEKIVATGMFPGYEGVSEVLKKYAPDKAVIEDFALYPLKSNAVAWNRLWRVCSEAASGNRFTAPALVRHCL